MRSVPILATLPSWGQTVWSWSRNRRSGISASGRLTRSGTRSFEIDQRNVGNSLVISGGGAAGLPIDRWAMGGAGTWGGAGQQVATHVALPGTNFYVTNRILRFTLSTAQASLGASDYLQIFQQVEGPNLRELFGDVSSVSLLVKSTVANLQFGLRLSDNNFTHSLVKLCSLGPSGTWTLITLPNLPTWSGSGSWSTTAGSVGYVLGITLGAGSSMTASANDVWVNAGVIGAVGQSNFAASPVNSSFDIAFVQHEPGSLCTTFIDKPFSQNYDECQRYYQKTYDYGTAPGALTATGEQTCMSMAGQHLYLPIRYGKSLAKPASMIVAYNPLAASGPNFVYDAGNTPQARAVGSIVGNGASGFGGFVLQTPDPAASIYYFHYTADTAW